MVQTVRQQSEDRIRSTRRNAERLKTSTSKEQSEESNDKISGDDKFDEVDMYSKDFFEEVIQPIEENRA